MNLLPQERTAPAQIFPAPREGERVEETPPSFCWLKVDGVSRYELVIRDATGATVWKGVTARNHLVPDILLAPGIYSWNLFAGDRPLMLRRKHQERPLFASQIEDRPLMLRGKHQERPLFASQIGDRERGWWRFEIVPEAVPFIRPSAADVFMKVPAGHPRHLFFPQDVSALTASRTAEIETLKRNIQTALKAGMPEPPRFHHDAEALPYREYFGRYRDFVDRDLVACALGHALLGDRQAGAHAVSSLLTICGWSPGGPCSVLGPWGDEVGLSNARCLPAVYDMVWDLLNEKERIHVEQTIATYALQCEELLNNLDFGQNPGNSHAGRVPAYLGEAALVLKGSSVPQETLERWLTLALDIYGSFFPYYGGPDGGWAEGTFYASSYTKWYLPFFMAVERYAGVRFLDRPFYQKVIQYFLHFSPPGWENHPFCDGYWCRSDDAEWPGFFAQNPYRLYAGRSGLDLAEQWARAAAAPELFKLHLLDVFIPDGVRTDHPLTGSLTRTRAFPDAGFVSLHTDPAHPDRDTALLARASRHGTASHQHADQGSFALIHRGRTLISPSGYFGRSYGTRHHLEWTKSTLAHNAILVDGTGQARNSHLATGRIVSCGETDGLLHAELDLSAAYPMLTSWIRRFTLHENGRLIIRDRMEAEKPVVISWLLHTLSEPVIPSEPLRAILLNHRGVHLDIIPCCGLAENCSLSGEFAVPLNEGVPEAYQVSMPQQFHLTWLTPAAAVHDIMVAFVIGDVSDL